MNRIITIGREFGSGGREIGRRLAEKLGMAYYDHEIVKELIARTHFAEDYIRSIDEKRPFSFYAMPTGRTFWPMPNPLMDQQMAVLEKEREVLLDMAKRSDCVIVGRRADYVLRDENPLRLFFYAEMDFKMAQCRKRERDQQLMSDKELRQKIQQIDKNRREYYEFFTGQKWGEMINYDLCLNTGKLGMDRVVSSITSLF